MFLRIAKKKCRSIIIRGMNIQSDALYRFAYSAALHDSRDASAWNFGTAISRRDEAYFRIVIISRQLLTVAQNSSLIALPRASLSASTNTAESRYSPANMRY